MLKILLPFPINTITQFFSQNANPSYNESGLVGHTGYDFGVQHGTTVLFVSDGYVYSVMNKDNPDPSKYRGVFQLVEDGDFVYEISYGHLDTIFAQPQTHVQKGYRVGTVGNTGTVYAGGRLVSTEEKLAGSKAGTHCHFQIRKCRKVSALSPNAQPVFDGFGVLRYKGGFLEVVDYNNGVNGCVDPALHFSDETVQQYNMRIIPIYQQILVLLQKQLSLILTRN